MLVQWGADERDLLMPQIRQVLGHQIAGPPMVTGHTAERGFLNLLVDRNHFDSLRGRTNKRGRSGIREEQ